MKQLLLMLAIVSSTIVLANLGGASDRDEIRPFHAIHVVDNEFECADCHEGVATSTMGTDVLAPTKQFCADCHDIEDPSNCSTCHSNAQAAVAPMRTTVAGRFPHQTHLDEGLDCDSCHATDHRGEYLLPDKAVCRDCHETASAMEDCGVCHLEGEPFRPANHSVDWREVHGDEARFDDVSCQNCHTQSDCLDCHASDNVRPRSHDLNFTFNHALQARSDELQCQTCHLDAEFCSSCHVAERVIPENHSRGDWVLSTLGGVHAEEARFDLESCAGCHDAGSQAPVCAQCHGE